MAPHSSTLAWKIPWAEEPGRLQSMGSLRVGHDWATSLSSFTSMHWRRKWQPTPVFCLENPRDGGTWWAAICGVAQSQTQLKRLSRIQNIMILFCYLSFIAEVWNPSWFLFLCWHLCLVYVCFGQDFPSCLYWVILSEILLIQVSLNFCSKTVRVFNLYCIINMFSTWEKCVFCLPF